MKDLEELTLMPTDISDFYASIVSAVEDVAECKRMGRDLFRTKDIKGEKTNFVIFPVEDQIPAAAFISACTEVTPVDDSWTNKTITLTCRIAVGLSICQEAIDDASMNVWKEGIENRGKSIAILEDSYLFDVLTQKHGVLNENGEPIACDPDPTEEIIEGDVGETTYSLANDDLIEIVSAKNDAEEDLTIISIDYCAGKIKILEDLSAQDNLNISYHYSDIDEDHVVEPATVGTLAYADIIDAIYKVKGFCEDPTILVVNSRAYSQLLKDTRFLDAAAYPSGQDVLARGEVGMIGGVHLVVSHNMPVSMALVMDEKRYALRLTKGGIYSKQIDLASEDKKEMYFYFRIGAGVLHNDACVKICNLASDADEL